MRDGDKYFDDIQVAITKGEQGSKKLIIKIGRRFQNILLINFLLPFVSILYLNNNQTFYFFCW